MKEICEYLSEIDFRYSIDELNNFTVRIVKDKVKLKFLKENKEKFFNIPAKTSMFANDIIDFLTSQKINKHEIFSNQIRKWQSIPDSGNANNLQDQNNIILE